MESKKITLSVAIAVYNEEKNIQACLVSVADIADEIIIVDGGSTDKTVELARKFTEKIIQTDNPAIFHINKQKALDACEGEWILQLDADEVVTSELKQEIGSLIFDHGLSNNNIQEKSTIQNHPSTIHHPLSKFNGYYIPRRNYFWGHFMKKGGQYPDAVIRLVRNRKAHFPCKSVHEQIAVDGEVETLLSPMEHYTYMTRVDYWKKADTYTTLTAKEIAKSTEPSIVVFFQYCLIKPLIIFLSIYVRHKGFVDGLTGFEFALYSALHFPMAYFKFIKSIKFKSL